MVAMAIDDGRPWTYEIVPQATLSALQPSPDDGRYLAYVTDAALTIIDDNQSVIASEPHGFSYVSSLDWHPSQAILATANSNRTVSLHHLNRDSVRSESFAIHDDAVNAAAFTTSSLLSASDDATIRAVSLRDGTTQVLRRLQSAGVTVRVHENIILVAELNGAVHLLDERTPQTSKTFQAPNPLIDADMAFPYVGVVTDHAIALYDLRRPAIPARIRKIATPASAPPLQRIRFSPCDTRVFALAQADGVVVWDVEQEAPLGSFGQKVAPMGLAWHPTRLWCYSGDDFQIRRWAIRERLKLYC